MSSGRILGQTLRPVAIGMSIGIAVGAAVVQVLQSAVCDVSPCDPVAFIGAPLLIWPSLRQPR